MFDLDINNESCVFWSDGGTFYRAMTLGGTSVNVAETMRPGRVYIVQNGDDIDGAELRSACKLTELFNPEQIE